MHSIARFVQTTQSDKGAANKAGKGVTDEEVIEEETKLKFIAFWAYVTTMRSTCCDGSKVQSTPVIGRRLPAW